MIPGGSSDVKIITVAEKPSKTFSLDASNNQIIGTVDDLEAVKQAVLLILGTNRFEHPIYSWNYGIESKKLIGKPMTLVVPELERYIKEALLQDDRISEVKDFTFKQQKRKLIVGFTVVSNKGNFTTGTEVKI